MSEIENLRAELAAERAGAETLDIEAMDALDKLSILSTLVLDMNLATPYGLKVKAYARYCLGQGLDPLREVLHHEQEGSESFSRGNS